PFRMRQASVVQPRAIVESCTLDNQRLPFPPADRVTHPRRVRITFKTTAVSKDLPIGQILVQDRDDRGALNDPLHAGARVMCRPLRQTLVSRAVLIEVLGAFSE